MFIIAVILAAFLLWLIPSWFVAMHAEKKGYSFWGFLVLGMLVSWPIALAAALILDNRAAHGPTTQCPDCAETILAAANICKHCGTRLNTQPA